jgi:pimeloyl-ACP methyl ester carboxylesterase
VYSPADREGYAIARDGSPIYYHRSGPEGGPTAVLCDGIGCDGYVWKYLRPNLHSVGWQTVHWNYRGHGRTPVPLDPRRVTIADMADDLAAVLDATGVAHAVLAGHSMGVQACLETFRRHRTRVSGLLLLCGSYGNPLRTFRGTSALDTLLPFMRVGAMLAPRVVRLVWRSAIPTEFAFAVAKMVEVNPELIRQEDFFPYLEGMARVDPMLFMEMLLHAGRHSARDLLPEIDVPTLVVAGDRDGFTPVGLSRAMADLIPHAELLVVVGGSHTAPIERPELVGETVLGFLARRLPAAPRNR